MTAVAFVVMVLAVARVVRLVTTDEITAGWRARLAVRAPEEKRPTLLVRLVNCNWCVGVWVAAVAAVLGRVSGLVSTWPWTAWAWLGIAGGSGLVLKWAEA